MTAQRVVLQLALGAALGCGVWFGIRPIVQALAYDTAAMAIVESMPSPSMQGEDR